MPTSAGILLYRRKPNLEVLLAHPGGPFWANKDSGAWTIPKGLIEDGEEPLEAAIREFEEETGGSLTGPYFPLGSVMQKSGKVVFAWAAEGEFDPRKLVSVTCKVVWPPGSGRWITVPEVDRCAWLSPDEASRRINPAQATFITRLQAGLEQDSNE